MFCKFPTDSSASPYEDCELDQGKHDDLDVSSAPSRFSTTSSCTSSKGANSRVALMLAVGPLAAN